MYKSSLLSAAALLAALSNTAAAQDYVAVQIEAENYTQKNTLWRVFSNRNQPNVKPDPDGSHHSSASGQSYLELLPDTRVTHGDQLRSGSNFWSSGGQGPAISYSVNFPEAGRYIVWVKAYSTGTEDNGIHVGVNGRYPGSGERIQWCSGKNKWTWSSAQRASNNHCGKPRTIYLDIPFAGANTINFSAREDGFEFDQAMFIKEKTSGLTCSPNRDDSISCNRNANGSVSKDNNNSATPAENSPTPTETPAAETPTPDSGSAEEETGMEVETEETQPTAGVSDGYPACTSDTSDPDGDGYGWENEQTCITTPATASAQSATTTSGVPVCASSATDSDSDGWGWENNQSCLVNGAAVSSGSERPFCASAASDSDGDGWGWENNRSCIVR
jgi:hypothetical protein